MGMKKTARSKKTGKRKNLLLITFLLAISVAVAAIALTSNDGATKGASAAGQADESLRRGETRATIDPSLFSHPKVRAAYQVAKEIPWVLDSIYCFCFCEENPAFRHKSLLSCYVDNHAAG
jgi:hypothetical protein